MPALLGTASGGVVEDEELAFCFQGRGRDEGFACQDARVGDEVPTSGIVCAVEDEIVGFDNREGGCGREVGGVGYVLYFWIQSFSSACLLHSTERKRKESHTPSETQPRSPPSPSQP